MLQDVDKAKLRRVPFGTNQLGPNHFQFDDNRKSFLQSVRRLRMRQADTRFSISDINFDRQALSGSTIWPSGEDALFGPWRC